MIPATNAAGVPDEQAGFEEWAKRTHGRPGTTFNQSHNGVYLDNRIAAKRAAWKAALAWKSSQAAAAPLSGWMLVPVEPTPEMNKQAVLAAAKFRYNSTGMQGFTHADGYRAMIAAAPAAPGTEAAPVEQKCPTCAPDHPCEKCDGEIWAAPVERDAVHPEYRRGREHEAAEQDAVREQLAAALKKSAAVLAGVTLSKSNLVEALEATRIALIAAGEAP